MLWCNQSGPNHDPQFAKQWQLYELSHKVNIFIDLWILTQQTITARLFYQPADKQHLLKFCRSHPTNNAHAYGRGTLTVISV